jgi:hypothetical protein
MSTQRATTGFSGTECPIFRDLIRRNPPLPLRAAYRRVVGLIAYGLFKIPSKSAMWYLGETRAGNTPVQRGESRQYSPYSITRSHNTRSHTGHFDVDLNYLRSAH